MQKVAQPVQFIIVEKKFFNNEEKRKKKRKSKTKTFSLFLNFNYTYIYIYFFFVALHIEIIDKKKLPILSKIFEQQFYAYCFFFFSLVPFKLALV